MSLWSGRRGSNSRPQPWQGCALPTELLPHKISWEQRESNPRPSACKADALNQLSYAPVSFLFADNCVRLCIFSRSLPQGNSLFQSLSSLFSTKINFNILAVRTGLEPATPGVTGRYSNQLNYRTNCSVLSVFPKRGCKGTQKIGTSKFFAYFFTLFCYLTSIFLISSSTLGFSNFGMITLRTPLAT